MAMNQLPKIHSSVPKELRARYPQVASPASSRIFESEQMQATWSKLEELAAKEHGYDVQSATTAGPRLRLTEFMLKGVNFAYSNAHSKIATHGELKAEQEAIIDKARELARLIRHSAFDCDARTPLACARMNSLGLNEEQPPCPIGDRFIDSEQAQWPFPVVHPTVAAFLDAYANRVADPDKCRIAPLITKAGQASASRSVFVRLLTRQAQDIFPHATKGSIYSIVADVANVLFDNFDPVNADLVRKLQS